MDIENENKNNSHLYKYSESGIRQRNYELWNIVKSIDLDIPFKEKFYLYENNIKLPPKCFCGNSLKFIDMKNGYREFCSRNCMVSSDAIKKKRRETCIEKYGVDNPSKSEFIKNIIKETNNKNFGVDYPMQSDEIKENNKKYFISKYGVDNPSKLVEIKEKVKDTTKKRFGVEHIMQSDEIKENNKKYFISKYGVDNPSKCPEIREKAKRTNKNRYGFEHALQNSIFLEKLKVTNNKRYGFDFYTKTDNYKCSLKNSIFHKNSLLINNDKYKLIVSNIEEYVIYCNICEKEFTIQRQLYRNRVKNKTDICLNCNPVYSGTSSDEKKLLNFIKESYSDEIIENFKLDKKEIDIYLPKLKIGFEFNGLYWHSELHKPKSYHLDKLLHFRSHEIKIYNIWEDDWIHKNSIVKSIVLNKLGKTPNKIFARKCQIKLINNNDIIREFLELNHIQGFVGSKIKIGLFYEEELVSVMTFGNLRKSLGQKSKQGYWELLRFCNKLNTNVVGGASKLLKWFIKNYQPDNIVSYSLNSYSNGDLYYNLGFQLISETRHNYFWVKNKVRYHRFNFRKDKLVSGGADRNLTETQIMYDRGYYRVFDNGSKKWIYNNKPSF